MAGTDDDQGLSSWARYVRAAVKASGTVSQLGRRSRVGRTSIYRYMNDDGTRVTIDVARRIADAINDDPANAIRAAGSLLTQAGDGDARLAGLDPADPVVQRIMSLDVDEDLRGMMLDRRRQQLAQRNEQDIAEIEFWANRGRGAA